MNVEIMSAKELVQWAKPETVLEKCLIEKLRETLKALETWGVNLEVEE